MPARNHEATTVARFLVDKILTQFGAPRQLLSDRGAEFEGKVIKKLCDVTDIDKLRTTSYHASCNDAIERFHCTLNSILGKVVSDNQRDWDELVSYALTAYRATKHSTTGFCPSYLVFGRELASVFELMFPRIPENEDDLTRNHWEYVSVLKDRYRRSYAIVSENLIIAAFRNKRKYDQRVKVVKYVPGDWVWIFYPRQVQGKSPKWQRYYDGPYLVLEAIRDVNYHIAAVV